jgi:hypothetical protein
VLVVHLVTVANGLGFVPGMLVAAPLVLLGLLSKPESPTAAYPLLVAVVALPLVWAFQYIGGALPQWGGRYTLPSCILLVALAGGTLLQEHAVVVAGALGLSVLVTVTGVLWLSERSHEVDRTFDLLVDRPEDVLVARNGFFVREGGAAYSERRWLTAVTDEDLATVPEVLAEAGLSTFAVIDRGDDPDAVPGARPLGSERLSFLGPPLYLHRYEVVG